MLSLVEQKGGYRRRFESSLIPVSSSPPPNSVPFQFSLFLTECLERVADLGFFYLWTRIFFFRSMVVSGCRLKDLP